MSVWHGLLFLIIGVAAFVVGFSVIWMLALNQLPSGRPGKLILASVPVVLFLGWLFAVRVPSADAFDEMVIVTIAFAIVTAHYLFGLRRRSEHR